MNNRVRIVEITRYVIECGECGTGIEHSRLEYSMDQYDAMMDDYLSHECGPKVTLACGAIIRPGIGGWDFDPTSPTKDVEHPDLIKQAWEACAHPDNVTYWARVRAEREG